MELPFSLRFGFKVLRFFLIIDLGVLPLILLSGFDLFGAYVLIILFEGFCSLVLGGLEIFLSLFSTIQRENHRYVGDGFWRYKLKTIMLKEGEKRDMRTKGVTLVAIGLLFILFPFIIISAHNLFT